jgi:hypothetical protein
MQPASANLSLGLAAKCGFITISRALGFGLFGLILNGIFLLVAWPEISRVFDVGFAAGAGLIFAVLLLLSAPIAYFVLGQKHGITSAMHYAFTQNRDFLLQTVLGKFREYVESRGLLTDGRAAAQLPRLLQEYLGKIDNLPKPFGWITKQLLKKVDVVAVASTVAQREDAKQMNTAEFMRATGDELGKSMDAGLWSPSLTWFWVMLTVNIVVFSAVKYFY